MPWALKSAGYGGWYERSHSCFSSEIVSSIKQGEKRQRDMSERFARMKQASEWAEVSEWVEREYQNAPSLDFSEVFWCVCCLNVVLSLENSVFHPTFVSYLIHAVEEYVRDSSKLQKQSKDAQVLQVQGWICSRMGFCKFISVICFRSRRTFRRLFLPSPVWTAFMFQTFCESYHMEMLFCQMNMTLIFYITLQSNIMYTYIFTCNYIHHMHLLHMFYTYIYITIIQLYGSILIHRFYEMLVTAFHSNFFFVRPRVRTCAVQLAGHLYGAHGKAHRICISKKIFEVLFNQKTTSTRLFPQQKKVQIKLHHVLSPPKRMSSHWGPDAMEPILQKLRPAKQAGQMVDGWCLEVRFCKNVWCGMIPQLSNYVWWII